MVHNFGFVRMLQETEPHRSGPPLTSGIQSISSIQQNSPRIAYDWLYDFWTDDQKSQICFTLNLYGLGPGVSVFQGIRLASVGGPRAFMAIGTASAMVV
jgi:hypothetical protein